MPRLALAGQPQLIVLRAAQGQHLFLSDEDRHAFLAALREAAAQHRAAVHAYALDQDHVHLLITPAEAQGLSLALQGLGRRYVASFNRRHGRRGRLWEGRYRATIVQAGPALMDALLFVDQHGVRRGLASAPPEDLWSSARHHLGIARQPWLTDCESYWSLGNTPFERESAYRRLLDEGLSARRIAELAEASRKGWAVGTPDFLAALAQRTGRPVRPRRRGRPPRDRRSTPDT